MTSSLYQKYRPKTWEELIGQNHVKLTLKNEIASKKFTHAYIFSGPRGVGKTTVARLLAKSVNCETLQKKQEPSAVVEPCNNCFACNEINKGKALDMIEIDAASHTGVDNVRENIIDNARVAPSHMLHKVFIIDEVHMLSASAFNALLKTIEEPPKNTLFILATTEIHKVPETIISRCQRFDFRRVGMGDLIQVLKTTTEKEKVQVEEEVLERIAKKSEGCIRDAQSLLGQILALGEQHVTEEIAELVIPRSDTSVMLTLLESLLQKKPADGLETVHELIESGANILEFTKEFIEFLREVMLWKVQGEGKQWAMIDFHEAVEQHLTELTQQKEISEFVILLEILLKKLQEMKYTEMQYLPLELAIIEYAQQQKELKGAEAEVKVNQQDKKQESGERTNRNTSQKIPAKKMRPVNNTQDTTDTLEYIKKDWNKILKDIRKYNHSLHLTLKVATLVRIKDDVLTLGFRYHFYKERMGEVKYQEIIQKVIYEITGKHVRLSCEIDKSFGEELGFVQADNIEKVSEGEVSNVWDLALNTFGGEIIKQQGK